MSSNIQVLRNQNGSRIGEIRPDNQGNFVIFNADGHRLGTYETKNNVTRDANGHRIGEGNLLTTLLRPF